MARSVNLMIILGNLGKDPEVRYTPAGVPTATLLVVTSDAWTDKETGERREEAEWHRVVLWRRLAELARDYLRKGRQVHVMGRKHTRSWTDERTGQKHYITEIVAHDLQILGGRGEDTPESVPAPEGQGS